MKPHLYTRLKHSLLCLSLGLGLAINASAEIPAALSAKINASIDTDKDRLVEMFKNIHQNPELGFMEVKTSAIIAEELTKLGFEVKTGIAKT
ncbi:MAG: amidohydrolase, partial [Saezia sp.]